MRKQTCYSKVSCPRITTIIGSRGDRRQSDQFLKTNDSPPTSWRAFLLVSTNGTEFQQAKRPGDRRHSRPPDQSCPHGRLHERRSVSQNRSYRICHVLQPLPQQTLGERRNLGASPGGEGDRDRL